MAKEKPDPLPAAPAVPTDTGLAVEDLALRLGLAAALGLAVAAVYFLTQRRRRAEAASFVSTLVLLTILLAMVSLVIGSDIARAFSLVGALSIVRFRTVVEDTRDTAFVIFAVIAGMAAGAGSYLVPAVGVPLVAAVAWGLAAWGEWGGAKPAGSPATASGPSGELKIRVGVGVDPAGPLAAALGEHLAESRLVSVGTARQGAAVDLTYAVRLKAGANPVGLIAAVNKVEGVQNAEWDESDDDD